MMQCLTCLIGNGASIFIDCGADFLPEQHSYLHSEL